MQSTVKHFCLQLIILLQIHSKHNVNYLIVFQTKKFVDIELTPATSSNVAYPKVFNVSLSNPTNGASIDPNLKMAHIVITNDGGRFQKLKSDVLALPLIDGKTQEAEIQQILKDMLAYIRQPPVSDINQLVAKDTIERILEFKKNKRDKKGLTEQSKLLLLDIFDSLLDPLRDDTNSHSYWSTTLEKVVYHLLIDQTAPYVTKETRLHYQLEARRDEMRKLNGAEMVGGRDFFRYPINMFSQSDVEEGVMVFILINNNKWFVEEGKAANEVRSILNNKVSAIVWKRLLNFLQLYYKICPCS